MLELSAARRWALMSGAAALLVSFAALGQRLLPLGPLGPLDARGRVPYFIGAGETRSGYTPADDDLARWAIEAWSRALGGTLEFEPAAEDDALLRVYFVPASYGQYGETVAFELDGRRAAAAFIRPDTEGLGPEIANRARADVLWRDTIVYLTCLHEIGHALGLRHTDDFDDIMYSFQFGGDIPAYFGRYRSQLTMRADIARVSALSPGDLEQLAELYPNRVLRTQATVDARTRALPGRRRG